MNETYPFSLEPLPYDYDALEPVISMETLQFHHDKHLATYVEKLNKALEPHKELHNRTLEQLLTMPLTVPDTVKTEIKNNGGGVYNHQLYFHCMHPSDGIIPPDGMLMDMINDSFGSFDTFLTEFTDAALSQFGSGYGWLVLEDGRLVVRKMPNQDVPLSASMFPLLPVDVWEHAYYLQYQNRRVDYVNNWLSLIHWEFVENRLKNHLAKA
jgi:Fe-Mn family superoxide dismutase